MRESPLTRPGPAGRPFLAGLALLVVGLRLMLFDYTTFFKLVSVPNHDMYQGASLFATSMHSMRLTGDIAWWNPVSSPGYAQYFQALLSPLAPTLGHVVFIVWAELVRALSLLGVAVPEYFQYLAITYVLLPFLATLAFAWLCSLLFRSRSAIVLATIAYSFSSIGLWNSAWFYFQEPATLLFLLGASINLLRRPAPRSVLLLLAAALVQLASVNYWTLFNSWFVVIFLGGYVAVHPGQVRRAGRRLVQMSRRWPRGASALAAGTLVVAALWSAVVGSAMRSESHLYQRGGPEYFSVAQALASVRPVFFLSRTFHPDIRSVAPEPLDAYTTMHHAVYLGAFLLPLLLVLPFQRPRRRELWLFVSLLGIVTVCFAPPPLVWAWEHVPYMSQVRHLFSFYPVFFRLLLILLSCASLDRILSSRRALSVGSAQSTLAIGVTAILLLGGQAFGPLQRLGGAPAALLLLVPAGFVSLALFRPSPRSHAWLTGVLLVVALADLLTYFRYTSQLDEAFTASRWYVQRPLPPEMAGALRQPWATMDPGQPEALFRNLPLANDFWPVNKYLPHRYVLQYLQMASPQETAPFLGFHPGATTEWMEASAPLVAVPHQWRSGDYNHWRVEVQVPDAGWLSVAQLYDPSWRATVDAQPVETRRTNAVRTAIRIDRGRHEVVMVYRPPSRRLYWPAAVALQAWLFVLGITGGRVGNRRRARIAPGR